MEKSTGKWIQKAIKPSTKGALKKKLGIKEGKGIPLADLKKATKSKSMKTRKQATLAMTLRKISKRK